MAGTHPRTFRLLLVEDSPGDVRLTREALRDCSVPVQLSVAEDGEKALAFLFREGLYAQAPRPDLILLDFNLPRKNGRQVLEAIKQHDELRIIPVLVFTTSGNPQEVLAAYQLHANSFIRKPLDLHQFIEAIRAVERFWLQYVSYPSLAAEADAH